MSDGANRRQILKALGVDVWVTRGAAATPQAPAAVAPAGKAATAALDSAAAALDSAAAALEPAAAARPKDSEEAAAAVATAATVATAIAPIAPFTVICLAKGGAIMLIEPTDAKAGHRFAADVLSAVSGVWGGKVDKVAFDWPQPGIAVDAESVRRALSAFVRKQIGDNAGGTTLIGEEVAARLTRIPEGSLILPPIDSLMTRGELKRALWESLAGRERR